MANTLPPNVRVSNSPLLRAKISLLRSKSTNARDTKALVHDISMILGTEALNSVLQVQKTGTVSLPLPPQGVISLLAVLAIQRQIIDY